ncbi:hypothetical protein D3C83_126630 [compost metagenome]
MKSRAFRGLNGIDRALVEPLQHAGVEQFGCRPGHPRAISKQQQHMAAVGGSQVDVMQGGDRQATM